MDPNQQLPVPQVSMPPNGGAPNPNDPYSFLHEQKPVRTGPSKQQILLIAVVAGVVVTLLAILFFVLFGSGSGNDELVSIAARQKEIIRVATLGNDSARSSNAKSMAITTTYAMTTANSDTLKYLRTQNRRPTATELGKYKSSKTTSALTSAKQAGQFDQTFVPKLRQELTDYQEAVVAESKIAPTRAEKDLLKKLYDQSVLLLKQPE
jgi:hypothetical protein